MRETVLDRVMDERYEHMEKYPDFGLLADTVGSGDAFSAGFIHYYMNGRTIEEALQFGNAAGSLVATTTGATAPISKDEILNFIAAPHERNSIKLDM